ncbi:hypothetical protein [Acinetobacter boissieri]|uniref:Uncharacterized protein n=1 Tax=Acinetobacter boissieri TaxID=1219383 RepID=A0A1G6GFV0_9GAMM|nr:hypothetical protein [Acinetobacter boissieri]SDB80830.1 hypothetical protein SAMN05421733_1019 [Acinetobacter boissieri]
MMMKIKHGLVASLIMASTVAIAAPTEPFTTTVGNVKAAMGPQLAEATSKGNTLTIISPRTGISYTLDNTEGRTVILQTDAIAAANNVTAKKIIAQNSAVSETSQLNAEKALIDLSAQLNP